MKRKIKNSLEKWKTKKHRKPLIMRGARQVGKTHSIRLLADTFETFLEINFEKHSDAIHIFEKDLDINRIIRDLELLFKQKIIPGKTLLFLDEIQMCEKGLSALRYFYEDCPELHVIAAGSLIEFALSTQGMPVGRVEYLYLYPMSFIEFLEANNESLILNIISKENYKQITEIVHKKILEKLAEYMSIGGMPEVVQAWIESKDLSTCQMLQRQINQSYRDDFKKYARNQQLNYIETIFSKLPQLLTQKMKYTQISDVIPHRQLSDCLELLVKSGVVTKIHHSNAQETPLGAGKNIKHFKCIFLDIGLAQALLGRDVGTWLLDPKTSFENKGEITEAFVGQELLAYSNPEHKETLYYWQRQAKNSQAKIDYIIQNGTALIPVEVKSGITGGLKSIVSYIQHVKSSSEKGILFSQREFEEKENYTIYPLYLIETALDI